jgi:hypothetical protein
MGIARDTSMARAASLSKTVEARWHSRRLLDMLAVLYDAHVGGVDSVDPVLVKEIGAVVETHRGSTAKR